MPNNIFYAPLAGCSDLPFRRIACRYRPGLVYCEMVKMDALVRENPATCRFLDYEPDMHPIGAQVCGSKPALAASAARIIEDLGFDVLDFNCGCPVDKVTKDGSGSGMLQFPERIGEILSQMVSAVKIPVTVKIRAGWDEKSINAPLIVKIAEQAGAKAITIHGRTREQKYKGPANWDYIRACKEVAKEIFVIGNGDLFDAESAQRMFAHTHCDAILVSRGTLGQPWIVEDMIRSLQGLHPLERDIFSIKQVLLDHFDAIVSYQNEKQAIFDFRRVGCWYLKQFEGARTLRSQLNQAESIAQVFSILNSFAWDRVAVVQKS